MDWPDFLKLAEAAMRLERFMVDEKKKKVAKEDPCSQNPSSMQGSESCNENNCYALGIQQRENFKTRSHVPFESRMRHGGIFQSRG